MSARTDHEAVEALRLHQPTGVRADDLRDLPSPRDRKRAIEEMRKAWGADAARSLEELQKAQLELGRLLAASSPDTGSHRDAVIERRRALDRVIEARRAEIGGGGAVDRPVGMDVLKRLFES